MVFRTRSVVSVAFCNGRSLRLQNPEMDADVDDGVWRMWRKGTAVSIFIAALFNLFLNHDYVFYESTELENRSHWFLRVFMQFARFAVRR